MLGATDAEDAPTADPKAIAGCASDCTPRCAVLSIQSEWETDGVELI
jgi:hypothetical protein